MQLSHGTETNHSLFIILCGFSDFGRMRGRRRRCSLQLLSADTGVIPLGFSARADSGAVANRVIAANGTAPRASTLLQVRILELIHMQLSYHSHLSSVIDP